MTNEEIMKQAMEEAEVCCNAGGVPFAVVVVDPQGQIVWKDHDRVKENMDPTAHGEVNAIRHLCQELKTLSLKGYSFYTTSEPCPTCLSSMIKAEVSNSFYGAKTEADASLPISAETIASYSKKYPIIVAGGVLESECLDQRNRLSRK